MSRVEELASIYERHVSAPWQRTLAGAQRVMMVVYEKELERLLRARLGEFEQATRRSGYGWVVVDCTRWFAEWMAAEDYREAYFEDPALLSMKLDGEFRPHVALRLTTVLESSDDDAVVALIGVASLYGFVRVSDVIRELEHAIRGRLVVFFPGTKTENSYRLLDARDGWNYLANGITLHEGGTAA
jgi:hypothetical protein